MTGTRTEHDNETLVAANAAADASVAAQGNERIVGSARAERLTGLAGNDTLDGGAGGDELDGGAGEDWARYNGSDAGVTVDLATGTGNGGHAEGDTLRNIENIKGSRHDDILIGNDEDNALRGGLGADTLHGGAGDDNLGGALGADTLYGGEGDDVLHGGRGGDVLDGGEGQDTARYRWSDAGVTVSLETGTGTGGHAQGDRLSNIEDLWGSTHDDTLTGDDENNVLWGWEGNDTLDGGAGGDVLDGGEGADTASYAGSDAAVNVNLQADTASGGHAEGDTLSGIENLRGSTHDDTLTGDDEDNALRGGLGDDTIDGGAGDDDLGGAWGNDTLNGGAGDDVLHGGAGADELNGGEGADTANYKRSDAAVDVDLGAGTASGGHAEGDVLTGIEGLEGSAHDDTLTGDDGGNLLSGLAGDDTLNGGAGDDRLDGGVGFDFLTGGAGDDTFVFRSDFSNDVITDFTAGEDMIEIVNGTTFSEMDIAEGALSTIISWDGRVEITLLGVQSTDITEDDFSFL